MPMCAPSSSCMVIGFASVQMGSLSKSGISLHFRVRTLSEYLVNFAAQSAVAGGRVLDHGRTNGRRANHVRSVCTLIPNGNWNTASPMPMQMVNSFVDLTIWHGASVVENEVSSACPGSTMRRSPEYFTCIILRGPRRAERLRDMGCLPLRRDSELSLANTKHLMNDKPLRAADQRSGPLIGVMSCPRAPKRGLNNLHWRSATQLEDAACIIPGDLPVLRAHRPTTPWSSKLT
mmetsp:Transcript_13987/g.41171  ORF Transcript_13987/g.41171 Transcript_13987/m.41171 type:complete len:233 (-) Transcript_13987:51-749(-)